MKVNRLGKVIADKGYSNLQSFKRNNNIMVKYNTLYLWVTRKATIYTQNLNAVDAIAKSLDTERNEVLNMMSTDPIYEVRFTKGGGSNVMSGLQRVREKAKLSVNDVATLVGVNSKVIYDLESGKRRDFNTSEQLKNYCDLLGLSFTEFRRMSNETAEAANNIESLKVEEPIKEPIEAPYVPAEEELEVVAVLPLPEIGATPVGYETKPVEVDKKADEVIRIIYGKVDYDTFRAVEKILREAEL